MDEWTYRALTAGGTGGGAILSGTHDTRGGAFVWGDC